MKDSSKLATIFCLTISLQTNAFEMQSELAMKSKSEQEQSATSNINQYKNTVRGDEEPQLLSPGRAFNSFLRKLTNYKEQFSKSDYNKLSKEKDNLQSFDKKQTSILDREMFKYCSHLKDNGDEINPEAMARLIKELDDQYKSNYDDRYREAIEQLSSEGQKILKEDVIPYILSRTVVSDADLISMSIDFPDKMKQEFEKVCEIALSKQRNKG